MTGMTGTATEVAAEIGRVYRLPAALFGLVKPGTKASVTSVVGGGHFNGTLRSVDRVIDAASGTFVARLGVPNPQGLVLRWRALQCHHRRRDAAAARCRGQVAAGRGLMHAPR